MVLRQRRWGGDHAEFGEGRLSDCTVDGGIQIGLDLGLAEGAVVYANFVDQAVEIFAPDGVATDASGLVVAAMLPVMGRVRTRMPLT